MSGRGRLGPVRDPAAAIAMAKCWLNTWTVRAKKAGLDLGLGGAERMYHQTECGFCEVPRDLLIKTLEEFVEWSEIGWKRDDKGNIIDEPIEMKAEIEMFETLSSEEKARLVAKAAGVRREDDEPWWSAP